MSWQPLNQLNLTEDWQFTDPTDADWFKFRHSNLGSVARALICQATIIDDEVFLHQIREISANQNEIWQIAKPAIFENRRLGFCQIYGGLNWNLQIDFEDTIMPTSNPGNSTITPVSYSNCTNARTALAANTAVQILAATPSAGNTGSREYAHFTNNGSADITLIYGPVTGATIEAGIPLKGPGGTHEINQSNLCTSAISALCASASFISVVQCTRS